MTDNTNRDQQKLAILQHLLGKIAAEAPLGERQGELICGFCQVDADPNVPPAHAERLGWKCVGGSYHDMDCPWAQARRYYDATRIVVDSNGPLKNAVELLRNSEVTR